MSLESNSQTTQTSSPQSASNGAVRAEAEFGNMFNVKGAESADPLAFIRNNLRTPPSSPTGDVVQPTAAQPSAPEAPKDTQPERGSGEPVKADDATPEPEFNVPIEEPAGETSAPGSEVDEDLDDPAQVNFKNLRSKFRAEKTEHKKTQELLEAVQKELEEYKEGRKLPDTVQSQEEELTRLRRYEKIVSIKTSPEYQEKYVKPLTETQTRLKETFAEYEIPDEYLSQLRGMKLSQQNEFLSEHFDSVAAVEVRRLLDQEKGIVGQMQQAEAEPEKELERLLAEANRSQAVRRKAEREAIQAELTSGWQRALESIKKEGVFVELIHKPNDKTYNDNVVNPILRNASQEASKFIAMLFKSGLRELSPEVSEYIANMTLLGHSSAINASSRQRAVEHAKTLEKNINRENLIQRPRIGGSTGAVGVPEQPRERLTPDKVGSAILGSIGLK